MPWQLFKRPRGRPSRLTVSITRQGAFRLSKASYEALGGPTRVVLLYSADTREIGFQAAGADDLDAHPVRVHGKGYRVSARAFLLWIGIVTPLARQYPARVEDGILIICLDNGTETPEDEE